MLTLRWDVHGALAFPTQRPTMLLSPILAAALFAAPLPQTDRFVDPVNGSDQATGTSAGSAWKTLTRGLELVAPGTTIKVLPGTLDVANGEDFPIDIPRYIAVESTEGPQETRIVADLLPVLLSRASRLEGFEVRTQSNVAIFGLGTFQTPSPPRAEINNCRVFAPNGAGIRTNFSFDMRGTFVQARSLGVNVEFGDIHAWDCEIHAGNDGSWALQLTPSGFETVGFRFERCIVTSPGGCAAIVGVDNPGAPVGFSFLNCEFRDCADGGIVDASANDRDLVIDVAGCTIANCGTRGIGLFGGAGKSIDLTLRSSIVSGHSTVDVMAPTVMATNSLVQDGSATGPGCLTGDPRFVDAAASDLRLRFDSPCKDVGVLAGEGLDVTRRARTIDGDLDLIQSPDMGAIEHRTLTAPASVALGDPLVLGMTGPASGFSFLVMDLNGLQSTPLSTPFGRLRVYGPTAMRLPPVSTTGGGPTLQTLAAFTDPALVGESVGFQALTRSTAAPAQAAFSNSAAVEVD